VSIKDELQNIISGNGEVRHGKIIQSISNYLRRKKKASSRLEKEKFLKKQEASFLIDYAEENQFFFQDFDECYGFFHFGLSGLKLESDCSTILIMVLWYSVFLLQAP